ncbi:MAG: GNAT family N-acetyltransferase [Pseudomonadota bacterium]
MSAREDLAIRDLVIRDLERTDEAEWRALWAGYLAFYEVDVPPAVTSGTWARLFEPGAPMFCRIAALDGKVAGFSISTLHPSTWTLDLNCYLEDLFVDPAVRGEGIGRALIDDLLSLANEKGWSRLYWHTNSGNEQARRLYDSYIPADDFVRYRIVLS